MENSHEFGKWLRGQMEVHNIGVREVARRAGISHTTVSKIKNLETFANADMAVAIGKVFNLSEGEALLMTGYHIRKHPATNERIIALLEGLDDDAIQRIIEIVEVLRKHELNR